MEILQYYIFEHRWFSFNLLLKVCIQLDVGFFYYIKGGATILEHGKVYMLESEDGDIVIASPYDTNEIYYWIESIKEYYGEEHCDYGGAVNYVDLNNEIKSGKYQIVKEMKDDKE